MISPIFYGPLSKYFETIQDPFCYLFNQKGEIYRQAKGRETKRIKLGHTGYFVKNHFGVGWKEIFKNLFQLKWPVISANTERKALFFLKSLKISTMEIAGFGERGWNPAKKQSFIITHEIKDTLSLDVIAEQWKTDKPSFQKKRALIYQLADTVKKFHANGLNHRDCYLCHFRKHPDGTLYVMDLHRAQIRKKTPKRWLMKDLAALYFSTMDFLFTKKDRLRFIKRYEDSTLRGAFSKDFWCRVEKQAQRLYKRDFKMRHGALAAEQRSVKNRI